MYYVPSLTAATLSSTAFTLLSTSFTRSSTQATLSSTPATRSSTSATLSSMPATLLSTTSTLSAIPATLLSIVFVTFRSCAAAIRASSCVSLSSLFSASSMSFFPISFFRYFSENGFVSGDLFVKETLTCSALLHFFCRNSDKVEDLYHNCCNRVHHSFIWCHFSVYVQTSEKCFYAFEHLKKSVLVRANGLSCLRIVRITMNRTKVLRRVHTERRTPNPMKITFAGENTCQINERVDLGQVHVLKHTELTPSPSVSEK